VPIERWDLKEAAVAQGGMARRTWINNSKRWKKEASEKRGEMGEDRRERNAKDGRRKMEEGSKSHRLRDGFPSAVKE
jgi:hypothetical protein